MVRIRFLICFFAALSYFTPSYAQDTVSVRASAKDDYTRLVFEWPRAPSYVTEKTGSALKLKFQAEAAFKIEGSAPTSLPRISSYKTPDAKTAEIGFIAGQDVRHFEIGNRVIVDIRGPEKTATEPPKDNPNSYIKPPVQPAEPVAAVKSAEKEAVQAAIEKPAVTAEKVKTIEPAASSVAEAPAAEPPAETELKASPSGPVTIQMTSTEIIGLAAFKRFGNLWIVVDKADYPVSPQISGAGAKNLGAFERVALKEATGFRLAVPKDMNFRAEGGGLVWKLISGDQVDTEPVALRVQAEEEKPSILWPVPAARRVIELNDPVIGDVLKVITVDAAKLKSGAAREFAEFGSLQSYAGLAIESKIDDLEVKKTNDGVLISDNDGLVVSPVSDTTSINTPPPIENVAPPPEEPKKAEAETPKEAPKPEPVTANASNKIYHFNEWSSGGGEAARKQQRALMAGLDSKTEPARAQDLITLAKMEIANGRGAEARGYLDLALQFVPELVENTDFISLEGAANTFSGEHEDALRNFTHESFKDSAEISLWKAYALASLEDWSQAANTMPKDPDTLKMLESYPSAIRTPISLALTETALRDGNLPLAEDMMKITETEKNLILPYASALKYMQGEALRQEGKTDETEKLWSELQKGKDDLYRAKAGLALTTLQLDKKKIKPVEAVDRLEGLRYAWRGDELETAISQKLGEVYVDNNEPVKGLVLLRQAAALSPSAEKSKEINAEMIKTFNDIFEPNRIKDVNPADAVSLHKEFSSLVPPGPQSHKIVRQLADRLVDADLLPRAAGLLQNQVDTGGLSGADGAETSIRLATIYLQDSKPDKALAALSKAESFLGTEGDASLQRQIALYKAQALSDQKKPEEALEILESLEKTGEVLRTKADIAWSNQRWQDAADALEELTNQSNISPGRPVDEEGANLLLNWAVALYLADNRYVLSNLREKYSAAMAASAKAGQFEVVTRPRQSALVSDRDTINSIIEETDIFKGFVNTPKPAAANANNNAPQAKTNEN